MKKAKLEALKKMSEEGSKTIPAHKVECPKCGHKWTMGKEEEYEEEEYEEEDDSEEEAETEDED
jgi:hypothetical protein